MSAQTMDKRVEQFLPTLGSDRPDPPKENSRAPRKASTTTKTTTTQAPQSPAEDTTPPLQPSHPLTCGVAEAAQIIGQPYEWTLAQSKVANPALRLPGFKIGKAKYAVIVAELPAWLNRRAGLA